MNDAPDLNDPRLLEDLQETFEPKPLHVDESEAELRELADLDEAIGASHYGEAKAKLDRLIALRALAGLRGDVTKANQLRFDRAQRSAERETRIALFSCRALGIEPEALTVSEALGAIAKAIDAK